MTENTAPNAAAASSPGPPANPAGDSETFRRHS
jgi:hypothetical protein